MMDKDRARKIMERHELDVLIGTARENIAYVTGLAGADRRGSNRLERLFVILPRDPKKETILIIPRSYLMYVLQNPFSGSSLRTIGSYYYEMGDKNALTDEERELIGLRDRVPEYASAVEAVSSALSDLGLGRQPTIGIDESQMIINEWTRLREELPRARMVEAYRVFREIRMVKTPAEVELLRRAAQVNEQAMLEAMQLIREGVQHRVIRDKLRQGMIETGATVSHDAIGFGWRSNYLHVEPSEYRARVGDPFKFDCGCFLNGYAADTARSGVIGRATPQQLKHYNAAREAQQLGIERLRVGMLAGELFQIMLDSIRKDLQSTTFMRHNFGHGIGRDVYDAPNISPGDNTVLEAGMVLNIEAPVYTLGFGGFTLEDTVHLKADGVEYLTHARRDLYIRP